MRGNITIDTPLERHDICVATADRNRDLDVRPSGCARCSNPDQPYGRSVSWGTGKSEDTFGAGRVPSAAQRTLGQRPVAALLRLTLNPLADCRVECLGVHVLQRLELDAIAGHARLAECLAMSLRMVRLVLDSKECTEMPVVLALRPTW